MAKKCTVPDGEMIAKGDAVCVAGFDITKNRPTVKRATRDNLATSKTVFGVAKDDAARGSVFVLVAGEVAENAVTSLGADNSRIIATDINNVTAAKQCKLVRIDRPDGSEYVVGTCDENGNLALQPRASIQTSAEHFFNVKAYGVVPDDAAKAAQNAVGLQALIDDADPTPGKGVTIHCPPGTYYFADDLHVTRPVDFTGGAGSISNRPAVTFRFAAGKGMIVYGPDQGRVAGGDATNSMIRGIKFLGETLALAGWARMNDQVTGDKIHGTDVNRYYYEFLVNTDGVTPRGKTGADEPEWPPLGYLTDTTITYPGAGVIVSLGTTLRDNPTSTTVFWECLVAGTTTAKPDFAGAVADTTVQWPPAVQLVRAGTLVRDLGVSTSVWWECTTPGTSGSGTPPWDPIVGNTTRDGTVKWTARSAVGTWFPDGDPDNGGVLWTTRSAGTMWIKDGSVVWTTRQGAGVWLRTRAVVEDCYFEGFTTAGISGLSTDYPATNCNHARIIGNLFFGCGVGIAWRGYDSSQWLVAHNIVQASGISLPGTGGVSIWDGSFLGAQQVANEVAAGSGQAYIVGRYDVDMDSALENPVSSALIGCYSEGGETPSILSSGVTVTGGVQGAGFDAKRSASFTALGIRGPSSRNIVEIDDTLDHRPFGYLCWRLRGLVHARCASRVT